MIFVAADSWPDAFDDSNARKDWNLSTYYDLERLVVDMFESLKGQDEKQQKEAAKF